MQVERSTKSQRVDLGQARVRAQGARAHIAELARDAHAYRARTRAWSWARGLELAQLRPNSLENGLGVAPLDLHARGKYASACLEGNGDPRVSVQCALAWDGRIGWGACAYLARTRT